MEEANIRTNMVAEHVGFKTNQEDRLRIAKARKDLFKYASDKKHKALLRQVRLKSLFVCLPPQLVHTY